MSWVTVEELLKAESLDFPGDVLELVSAMTTPQTTVVAYCIERERYTEHRLAASHANGNGVSTVTDKVMK